MYVYRLKSKFQWNHSKWTHGYGTVCSVIVNINVWNLTFDGIFVSTFDLLLNLASSFSCVSHLLRFNRFQSITSTILRNDSPIAQNLWQADLKHITLYIYQIDTSNLTLKSKVSPIRSQKFLPNRLPSDS